MRDRKILTALYSAVDEVNELQPQGAQLVKTPETVLTGTGGALDSMGAVNLVLAAEDALEREFGIRLDLADQSGYPEDPNPLSTLAALSSYVDRLLEAAGR